MQFESDYWLQCYISYFLIGEDEDRYHKRLKSVCPLNMKAVNCNHNDRKIEIQSVELKQYSSFCEKQNKNRTCTECFQTKVNAACNGKQRCEQLTWNGCDDCSRLSKFAFISFSCKCKSRLCLLSILYITQLQLSLSNSILSPLQKKKTAGFYASVSFPSIT